jgi:copper chaperone
METVTLTAPDISCEHCKNAIEKAVGAMPGVSDVDVAIDPKQVTVVFDPSRVSLDQIKETLDEEGYPVAGTAAGPTPGSD